MEIHLQSNHFYLRSILTLVCSISNIFSLKVVFIDVDVEAEQALVLHLCFLCDHQHILFSNHVVDDICDLLGLFGGTFNCRAGSFVTHDRLKHSVDNLTLLHGLLAVLLGILESADDTEANFLILLERDFDLFITRSIGR